MAITTVVYWLGSIVWAVLAGCIVSAAVVVFYDRPGLAVYGAVEGSLLAPLRNAFDRELRAGLSSKLKHIMRLAGPLGIVLMFVSLNASLCRYWLDHFHGEREVGLFTAISYIAIAANTAVMALGQASGPGMARSCVHGDAGAYLRQALRLGAVGLLIGIGGVAVSTAWGPEVIRLFYGKQYVGEAAAFRWLMLGAAFSFLSNCAGYTLSSARYVKEQFPMHLAVGAAISLAAWWWVPQYGVLGAAYAQTLGYLLQLVISLVMVERVYRRVAGSAAVQEPPAHVLCGHIPQRT